MWPALRDVVLGGYSLVDGDVDLRGVDWGKRPPRLSRMDRLCTLALVAAQRALENAGIDPHAPFAPFAVVDEGGAVGGSAGLASERLGVVIGTAFGCHATNEEYFRGVLREGALGASPRLFAYTLPSSPLGEISIHFGARGPAQTLVSGRHAGLEGLGHAARLCDRGLADRVLFVAVEVGGGAGVPAECESGAVGLVVERGEFLRGRGGKALALVSSVGSGFSSLSDSAPISDATNRPAFPGGAVEGMAALVRFLDGNGKGPKGSLCAQAFDPAGGSATVVVDAVPAEAPVAPVGRGA